MYHYTYQITVNNPTDNRRFYIGARTSKVKPEDDMYFGSCRPFGKWQKDHGISGLTKQVLAVWPTRQDAVSHEILLHNCFNVAVNPEFWNQAKQTAILFDTTGAKQSEELKLQKSLKTKGIPKSEEHKAKIAASNKGKKVSELTKEKISQSRKGKPSPLKGLSINKGVPKSEEHKAKIGDANRGKKRSAEICKKYSEIRKGKKQPFSESRYEKITCPHCEKIGMKANMKRYHFDNCKEVR
jgi:hypothetical protein